MENLLEELNLVGRWIGMEDGVIKEDCRCGEFRVELLDAWFCSSYGVRTLVPEEL